jgi:hypothetical protein
VRYLRIYAGDDGASRFEEVELKGTLTHIVDGVPPLLVSGPFACRGIKFVEVPKDATDSDWHVAPCKLWVIVLSGRGILTTSDGKNREIGPGDVILAEDTTGKGHLSKQLTEEWRLAFVPVA